MRLWHSRIKSKLREALKKLPARSSADTIETTTRLAEHLTQLDRSNFVLSSSVLQKNQNSIVHRLDVCHLDPSERDPILHLVVKKAKHAKEARLYSYLTANAFRHRPEIVPQVHSVRTYWVNNPDDYKSFVVLEHLPKCGLVDYSEATAHQLAEKMSAISMLPSNDIHWVGKADNQLGIAVLEQFITASEERGYVASSDTARILEDMRRNWHKLSAMRTSRLLFVPCHNDLHIKNIGVSIRKDRSEYVFFDWEKFGLNYLGADLHHFITKGISEPDFKPFSDALHKRYREIACDAHSVDERSVEIGALSYSLFRCVTRSVLHKANKKRPFQLDHVVTLYKRLRELACVPLTYLYEYMPFYV